jgi:ribonuclease BN (tRNA processing enzyme)
MGKHPRGETKVQFLRLAGQEDLSAWVTFANVKCSQLSPCFCVLRRSASFAHGAGDKSQRMLGLTPLRRSRPFGTRLLSCERHRVIIVAMDGVTACGCGRKGVKALNRQTSESFLTHLQPITHSDSQFSPWIMGRKEPLELYGPPGTREMVQHILQAYDVDIKVRTEGLEHSNRTGYKVNVHEITPGVVYKDANITVKAFNAYHGAPKNTFGYRFETPDRVIVIAGDSTPKSDVLQNCNECDVLIHEAYTQASFEKVSPEWKQYREMFHTSTRELAEIANKAKPHLLVLYHRGNAGCDQARTQDCRDAGSEGQMLQEIRELYRGKVVAGHDLDVF